MQHAWEINACKVWLEGPKGRKITPESHRRRWKDNIKMDLEEIMWKFVV
jgi:hypothetical protein